MLFRVAGACAFLLALSAVAAAPPPPDLSARAWLLLDYTSGQQLAAHNPDRRIEPASLTKLMTAYLVFKAIKQGRLDPDATPALSEGAWRAEGSRMFVDPKHPAKVSDLLKGMIVISGNDAALALAEAVGGTEPDFVVQMNREAGRLGMRGTHYMNATGLPAPGHYTTVGDLALIAAAIVRDFPEFYPLYSLKEYTWNRISQPNRNRLLWLDPFVDGMKTGHTASAGYCLIASAKRGERRLISVVAGAASETQRAVESQKLLNYGFEGFDSVRLYRAGEAIAKIKVWRGAEETVAAGFPQEVRLAVPRGAGARLKATLTTQQPLFAPIAKGAAVGTVNVTLDGGTIAKLPVNALEAVPVSGFLGRAWDNFLLWIRR